MQSIYRFFIHATMQFDQGSPTRSPTIGKHAARNSRSFERWTQK